MSNPLNTTTLLWCGRFSRPDGYGTVSRNHLVGLVEAGARVAAFDLDLMELVGPECGAALVTRPTKKTVTVAPEDENDNVAVVFHERPDMYSRIRVDGRAALFGHSVFETEGLPPGWVEPLTSADEVWVASDFNRRSFAAAGVPSFMMHKIPHSLETRAYDGRLGTTRLAGERTVQFLSVCSSLERRDLGLLFRSFLRAFEPEDDVVFVVKLRDSLATVQAAQTMLDQSVQVIGGSAALLSSRIRLLPGDYSREEMIRLYGGCDVYVSPERANGWDLPTMEAMASGKLAIGADTGGATEYAHPEFALRIPVDSGAHVPIPSAKPHPLYTAQSWSGINEDDVVQAMRRAYADAELRATMGKMAQRHVSDRFDTSVVAQSILGRVTPLEPTRMHSMRRATVTIGRQDSVWRQVNERRSEMVESALAGTLLDAASTRDASSAMSRYRAANQLRGRLRQGATGPIARALGEAVATPKSQGALKTVRVARVAREVARLGGGSTNRRRLQTLGRGIREMQFAPFDEAGYSAESIDARRAACGQFPVIPLSNEEQARLKQLRSTYYGERCFILGNGPSLNRTDLSKLAGEHTFGVNKIYLLFDRIDWRPTFYSLLDWRVGPEIAPHVGQLDDSLKFIPNRFRGLFPDNDHTAWYTTRPVLDDVATQFAPDVTLGVPSRGTILVTAIQLAFHLGFREIYLIGTDASYTIPDTVRQSGPDRHGTGIRLNLESTADDDPNHFDPTYFGKGAQWHDPNVDEMVRMFRTMRKGVELHGGRLINATVGGKLEVLPRVDYESLF